MDLVHEAEEPGDIGVCHDHNRVFECYCNQCYWYCCVLILVWFALHVLCSVIIKVMMFVRYKKDQKIWEMLSMAQLNKVLTI